MLLLAGCTQQPIISTVLQPNVPVDIPDIDPLTLNPVQWQVLSLPQLKQLVATIERSSQQQPTIFLLDTRNYKNLTLNFIEIQRYISAQKAVLSMLTNIIKERSTETATPHE
jgi:hypothetical protein